MVRSIAAQQGHRDGQGRVNPQPLYTRTYARAGETMLLKPVPTRPYPSLPGFRLGMASDCGMVCMAHDPCISSLLGLEASNPQRLGLCSPGQGQVALCGPGRWA